MGKSDAQKSAEKRADRSEDRADRAEERAGKRDKFAERQADLAENKAGLAEEATKQDRVKSAEQRRWGVEEEARLKQIGQKLQGRVAESRGRMQRIGNMARDQATQRSYAAMRMGGMNPALAAINAGQQGAEVGASAAIQGQNALSDFDRAERGRNDQMKGNVVNRQMGGQQMSMQGVGQMNQQVGLRNQQTGLRNQQAASSWQQQNAGRQQAAAGRKEGRDIANGPFDKFMKGATALGGLAQGAGGVIGGLK